MQWGILGSLEVRAGDRPIDLGGPKQRAVLAFLLVHVNEVVALDRLIDGLWGEAPPARATATLQVFISNLRRALEPERPPRAPASVLLTQPPGYLLRLASHDLDAARFEARAEDGRRHLLGGDALSAHTALTDALSLWRGPALAEFADEAFAQPEASRLERLRVLALEDRVRAAMDLGRHRVAVAELEALLAEHPLRERLWGMLMLAEYRAGSQADALRSFQRARRRLGEELGIEPGPALQQLERDIVAHSPTIEWQPQPDVMPADGLGRPTPRRAAAHMPLVGRLEHLSRLEDALGAARDGRPRVVLVSGEPGIGKTRLAQELADRAETSGMAVAWGHCVDRGPPPYWPWVQILRKVLAAPGGAGVLMEWERATLAQLLPELHDTAAPPPAPVEPAQARFQLYAAATDVLVRISAGRPFCLVVDDLHWADLPALQLMTQFVTGAGTARLLLVGTYRETEIGDDLADTLATLVREPSVEHLTLAGLDVEEVAELVTNATGMDTSPSLAASLHARTAGNPFFLTELLRLLQSEHALDGSAGNPVPGEVPPGVRDVIRRRLARLPEQTTVLLTVGAVAGVEFDHHLLEAVGGLGEERTLELMEVATVTGIVTEADHLVGRYRFSHPLIRQTVYDGLSSVRRARLHARVAEGLESLYGESAVVEIAHHLWSSAGEASHESTLSVTLRAAEVSLGQLAYEQAAEQLRRAAELLQGRAGDADAARQELAVQLRLAQLLAMTRGSKAPETDAALTRAQALSDIVGHEPELLAALWGLFFALALRCEIESARRLAQHLLEVAGRTGDALVELAAHLGLGISANLAGDLSVAHEEYLRATALADVTSGPAVAATFQMDPGTLVRSLHSQVMALRGDAGAAAALGQEAIARAGGLGDQLASVIAHLCSAMNAFLIDDVDAVENLATTAAAMSAATGFRGLEAMALALTSWVLHRRQDYEEARSGMRESLAIFATTGNGWGRSLEMAIWAEIEHTGAGEEEALGALDELLRPDFNGEGYYEAEVRRRRAELVATLFPDRLAEAIADVAEAVAVARRQGARALEARALASLARLDALADSSPSSRGPSSTSTEGTSDGSASRRKP